MKTFTLNYIRKAISHIQLAGLKIWSFKYYIFALNLRLFPKRLLTLSYSSLIGKEKIPVEVFKLD